jgi:GTPase involved in cell partitioning and DNA repair
LKGDIATWYAIYNPVFFNYLFNINYSEFKREDFLKKVFDQNKKIIDLSGIVIDSNANDFNKITKEFKALNIKIEKQKPGLVIYKLDSVTIKLKLAERKNSMIKELRFRSKDKTRLNINLGNIHIKNSTSNQISMMFE